LAEVIPKKRSEAERGKAETGQSNFCLENRGQSTNRVRIQNSYSGP